MKLVLSKKKHYINSHVVFNVAFCLPERSPKGRGIPYQTGNQLQITPVNKLQDQSNPTHENIINRKKNKESMTPYYCCAFNINCVVSCSWYPNKNFMNQHSLYLNLR